MRSYRRGRPGFTLIELLIVISIIAVLATLTIVFFPSAAANARESRAAALVQGWLNIAKQRALRDQAPRGLRLWFRDNTFQVTECQYLEQPEDFNTAPPGFTAGRVGSALPTPPPAPAAGYTLLNTIGFTPNVDLVNGYDPVTIPNYNDPNVKYWSIQPGDYLELRGSGLVRLITQVGVPDGNGTVYSNYIVVSPPLPVPLSTATPSYRIVRAPRPVGEETLKLPAETMIDLATNAAFGNPLPMVITDAATGAGYVDVVFAPSGAVITRGVATPNIHLWVRAPDPVTPANVFAGDPTIVSIFARTGFVGAYAPVPPSSNANPYVLVN
ncbi:MAG: prepilin-type N-terminal cleavage/methylation domain-containing protein [Planctomycetes bacterium]|nr:prepilin-type N-terminal cleavage/methylation domain-containing protein [Planctomycetota bacterium]